MPHTPGPWIFEPHPDFDDPEFAELEPPFGYISTSLPTPILELSPLLVFPKEELTANAILMAAAPDLLAALLECKRGAEYPDELGEIIDAAIAKATTITD